MLVDGTFLLFLSVCCNVLLIYVWGQLENGKFCRRCSPLTSVGVNSFYLCTWHALFISRIIIEIFHGQVWDVWDSFVLKEWQVEL